MKKLLYTLTACASVLMLNGCRQQEEFNDEDTANLQLIKKGSDASAADGNNAGDFNEHHDGDPIPPPKK